MNDQLFKRRPVSNRSLARRVGWKQPRTRILVVTEGQKTEVRYFRRLIPSLGLSDSVVVDVDGECGSAPISIADRGIELALQEGKAASGGYSAVFCVFDRDQHTSYQRAVSKILDTNKSSRFPTKIFPIRNIPCIEFWFILHFQMTRMPFEGTADDSVAEVVLSYLKRIPQMTDYEKCISDECVDELVSRTASAYDRAIKCSEDAMATGEENPSTEMHVFIDRMREFSRKSES